MMNKYVVLLRGINVGGKNKLPMKELKALLLERDFKDVKTYIQSGNIILKASNNPSEIIAKLIGENFGFTPSIITLSEDDFVTAVLNNPYLDFEGKFVHFYFCENRPKLVHEKVDAYKSLTESYTLIDNILYIHAPDGIARSKFVANVEKCLGVSATGRNLNTINKLNDMLKN